MSDERQAMDSPNQRPDERVAPPVARQKAEAADASGARKLSRNGLIAFIAGACVALLAVCLAVPALMGAGGTPSEGAPAAASQSTGSTASSSAFASSASGSKKGAAGRGKDKSASAGSGGTAKSSASKSSASTAASSKASSAASAKKAASASASSKSASPSSKSVKQPAAKPSKPVQTGSSAAAALTVTVIIDASNAGDRAGGVGLRESCGLPRGATAYDALVATGVSVGGTSMYVSSIGGLAEFDCGKGSGWIYKVNGTSPNKACGKYPLANGDVVEWIYTVDMGKDV